MKRSRHFVPTLFVVALVGATALALLSPVGAVMAESGLRASDLASAQCENREVEADEGYGVSHRVIREICR